MKHNQMPIDQFCTVIFAVNMGQVYNIYKSRLNADDVSVKYYNSSEVSLQRQEICSFQTKQTVQLRNPSCAPDRYKIGDIEQMIFMHLRPNYLGR